MNGDELVDLPEEQWWDEAACRGLDPTVFYPVSEDEAEAAKAVCRMCDVRVRCLEYALESRERDGVWGGASERDRRRIIRQRRRGVGIPVYDASRTA